MVLILSGPVHGGKTTFLERRLPFWLARGLACDGFLSPVVIGPGGPSGYDLLEIASGRRRPYLRTEGPAQAERVGPYVFVPETLERARAIIRGAAGTGLLVVDEVGPLELQGEGLWSALGSALPGRTGTTLLVAREGIAAELAERFAPLGTAAFDVRAPDAAARLDERLFGTGISHDRQG
jgi:nucleoside-triphosphatase THEP1